jgi:hypothetical protein
VTGLMGFASFTNVTAHYSMQHMILIQTRSPSERRSTTNLPTPQGNRSDLEPRLAESAELHSDVLASWSCLSRLIVVTMASHLSCKLQMQRARKKKQKLATLEKLTTFLMCVLFLLCVCVFRAAHKKVDSTHSLAAGVQGWWRQGRRVARGRWFAHRTRSCCTVSAVFIGHHVHQGARVAVVCVLVWW